MQYLKQQDDGWDLESVVWTEDDMEDVTERDVDLIDLRVRATADPDVGEEWDRVIFSRYHNGDTTTNQVGCFRAHGHD